MSNVPQLRHATREDFPAIARACIADKTQCVAPTHVLELDGDVVGYGSAGQLSMVAGWTAPDVTDEESIEAFRKVEAAAIAQGAKFVVVVCTDDCRFKPYMEPEGYRAAKTGTLYIKKVR